MAEAIDRWVWYAGWPDKVAQVAGAANPVAGPYFNFSVPEPTGVVAVVAPAGSSLLGLVSVLAPVIATGNTAVVVASETAPLPAVTLAEVLATSDVPPGVVNMLTGRTAELAPVLAAHMDVNAIDLTGAAAADRAELERLAAGNVKRVFAADDDWAAPPGPGGCWRSWRSRRSGTRSGSSRRDPRGGQMSFNVSADSYLRFMGRYSEPLASQFADLAGVRPGQARWMWVRAWGAFAAELVGRLGPDEVGAARAVGVVRRRGRGSGCPGWISGRRRPSGCRSLTRPSTPPWPSWSCISWPTPWPACARWAG